MKLLQRLAYRVKRLFNGPSGIVENIDVASEFPRDRLGTFPQRVTYRTPLEEQLMEVAWIELKRVEDPKTHLFDLYDVYKIYTIGDRFP